MAGIDERQAHATKNPIQGPTGQPLPEVRKLKHGPGWLRRQAEVVGPDIRTPNVNTAAQSSRSDAVVYGQVNASERDPIVGQEIDREALVQDQQEMYGRT
jgi:hypothetical protein